VLRAGLPIWVGWRAARLSIEAALLRSLKLPPSMKMDGALSSLMYSKAGATMILSCRKEIPEYQELEEIIAGIIYPRRSRKGGKSHATCFIWSCRCACVPIIGDHWT
jgi:hypothetical protein